MLLLIVVGIIVVLTVALYIIRGKEDYSIGVEPVFLDAQKIKDYENYTTGSIYDGKFFSGYPQYPTVL